MTEIRYKVNSLCPVCHFVNQHSLPETGDKPQIVRCNEDSCLKFYCVSFQVITNVTATFRLAPV